MDNQYIVALEIGSSKIVGALAEVVASGNTGVTGLESEYNSILNGTDGRSFGYQNEDNSEENNVIEPVNGTIYQRENVRAEQYSDTEHTDKCRQVQFFAQFSCKKAEQENKGE